MNIYDIQRLYASAGLYKHGIDGDAGVNTMKAAQAALSAYGWTGGALSKKRTLIAAAQSLLNAAGFEAGTVDGYAGHNTKNAFSAWEYKQIHGTNEVISREANGGVLSPSDLPRQSEVASFYGRPGDEIKGRLKTIEIPYLLRIDYNLRQKTRKMTVHEKCAPSLFAAMIAVHSHYGMEEMKELGLDRYAGGYNHRKMRGGSSYSMHAYGCAVDFYAAPNGLRMKCPQALFCAPVYKPFLDIMERYNWLPAIRLWGSDAMHFQQARL